MTRSTAFYPRWPAWAVPGLLPLRALQPEDDRQPADSTHPCLNPRADRMLRPASQLPGESLSRSNRHAGVAEASS